MKKFEVVGEIRKGNTIVPSKKIVETKDPLMIAENPTAYGFISIKYVKEVNDGKFS